MKSKPPSLAPDAFVNSFLRKEILEFVEKERLNFMSLISSVVVREIQVPLGIIQQRIKAVLREPSQESSAKLAEVLQQAEHLFKNLDLMVVPFDSAAAEEKSFALKGILDQVASYFQKERLKKGVILYVDINPGIYLNVELNSFKLMLMALIHHSLKSFIVDDSSNLKCINIYATVHHKDLHLIISDTGRGMAINQNGLDDDAQFLNLVKQIGFNLLLAKKISTDLGIEMKIVGENGKGTNFILTLGSYFVSNL